MRSQGGEGGRHTSAPRNDSTNDLGEPGKSYRLCIVGLGSDFLFTFVFHFDFLLLSFFSFWLYFWLLFFSLKKNYYLWYY